MVSKSKKWGLFSVYWRRRQVRRRWVWVRPTEFFWSIPLAWELHIVVCMSSLDKAACLQLLTLPASHLCFCHRRTGRALFLDFKTTYVSSEDLCYLLEKGKAVGFLLFGLLFDLQISKMLFITCASSPVSWVCLERYVDHVRFVLDSGVKNALISDDDCRGFGRRAYVHLPRISLLLLQGLESCWAVCVSKDDSSLMHKILFLLPLQRFGSSFSPAKLHFPSFLM